MLLNDISLNLNRFFQQELRCSILILHFDKMIDNMNTRTVPTSFVPPPLLVTSPSSTPSVPVSSTVIEIRNTLIKSMHC